MVNRRIKLHKLKWVNIRGYRNLEHINGKVVSATISREKNGKYYVSVLFDMMDIKSKEFIAKSSVGIDLGIKKLITQSDGIIIENNKYNPTLALCISLATALQTDLNTLFWEGENDEKQNL